MIAFRVYVSNAAYKDICETVTYIANELLEPHTANRLLDTLQDAINSLSENPHRHKLVDRADVFDHPIRMFTVENYIIFYLINENEKSVDILRVLYGRRDWTYLFR
jgi:toxin ParE1/3/4